MGSNTWNKFLEMIMKVPGAAVSRDVFLANAFKKYPLETRMKIINGRPLDVVDIEEIDQVARRVIMKETAKVTSVSTVSGIPGGLGLLATVPVDMVSFYFHIITLGQKLGYLYGYDNMLDKDNKLTEEGRQILTGFIGVMNNVTTANEIIKAVAKESAKKVSQEAVNKMTGTVLSKKMMSHTVENVAKKLGAQITAKSSSRVLTKVIPLISGVVCGALTLATFRPAAARLQKSLRKAAVSSYDKSLAS